MALRDWATAGDVTIGEPGQGERFKGSAVDR